MYSIRTKLLRQLNLRHVAYKSSSAASAEPFLNGSSSSYVEEMYESWRADPSSVHKSWQIFFARTEGGAGPGEAHESVPNMPLYPIYSAQGTQFIHVHVLVIPC